MKNSKICWSLVLVLGLALAGVTRLASAQWVGNATPTPVPIKVLNGAEDSKGKNAKGVEESTEKGRNGKENKDNGNKWGMD